MKPSPSVSNGPYAKHPIRVRRLSATQVIVFDQEQGSALIEGSPTDGALVRIQSACQYGEIYGSVECDCRDQLDYSLEQIGIARQGVIVHLLQQEGRGEGLWTKALAYRLRHDEGLDSFAAYERLGVSADSRDYTPAVEVLRYLGLQKVKLMTNNPKKIEAVESGGIAVTRHPIIKVDSSDECQAYFESKLQNGHLGPDEVGSGSAALSGSMVGLNLSL